MEIHPYKKGHWFLSRVWVLNILLFPVYFPLPNILDDRPCTASKFSKCLKGDTSVLWRPFRPPVWATSGLHDCHSLWWFFHPRKACAWASLGFSAPWPAPELAKPPWGKAAKDPLFTPLRVFIWNFSSSTPYCFCSSLMPWNRFSKKSSICFSCA